MKLTYLKKVWSIVGTVTVNKIIIAYGINVRYKYTTTNKILWQIYYFNITN